MTLGSESGCDDIIQLRGMAEEKNGRRLAVLREFTE